MSKLKPKILFLLFSILFLFNNVIAQELTDAELDVEDDAIAAFEAGDYQYASEKFSQLLSLHPKDANFNYYYAVCLIKQNKEIDKAIKFLEYAKNKTTFSEVYFYLGEAYHLDYNFDKAISYYKKFKEKYGKKANHDYNVNRKIELAQNGKELLQYISDLTVLENKKIKQNNFYYSYKLNDIGGKIIVKPDEFKTKKDKKNPNTQLMFLSDSGVVYFSSYGKKGVNGLDIYKAKKNEDGSWSQAEVLPPSINTKYDEDYPYLWVDGKTLYFSSKGHNSMGGYDIFRTVFDSTSNTWSKPENLDFPTNTPYDDFLYVTDSKDVYAYFSSNRETSDDKISVYKILIDHYPERKTLADINEIKSKARLKVSTEEEINKTKQKNQQENKELLSDNIKNNTIKKSNFEYNFPHIKIEDIKSNSQLISEVKLDSAKIAKEINEVNNKYKKALILAYKKQKESEEKRKTAIQLNKSGDKELSEKTLQEADDLLQEAILAYDVAQLKKSERNTKKQLLKKNNNIIKQVASNNDIASNVKLINNNRKELEKNKNLFKNIDDEIRNKKAKLRQINKELSVKQQQLSNIKESIKNKKQEIEKYKQTANNNNITYLNQLIKEHNNLVNQYAEINADKNVLEQKQTYKNKEIATLEKLKQEINNAQNINEQTYNNLNEIELKNKIDENSFEYEARVKTNLKNISEKVKKQDVKTMLIAENNINTSNGLQESDNQTIETTNTEETANITEENKGNSISENNTSKQTNNAEENKETASVKPEQKTSSTGKNNTTIAQITVVATATKNASENNKSENKSNYTIPQAKTLNDKEKNATVQEVENLKYEASVAENIADSLDKIINNKKQLLQTETAENKKQALQKEIDDLVFLSEMKKQVAEQRIKEANALEKTYLADNNQQNPTDNQSNASQSIANNDNIYQYYSNLKALKIKHKNNKTIIDSLLALSEEKQKLADKTKDESEKQMILAEVNDLNTLANKKQTENNNIKKQIETTQNDLYTKADKTNNIDDIAQISNFPKSTNNLPEYEKQLILKTYYNNKNKELKNKLNALEQTRENAISNNSDVSEINKKISLVKQQINENNNKQAVAEIKLEQLKKQNNVQHKSEEKIFADATKYELKHTYIIPNTSKQKLATINKINTESKELYSQINNNTLEINNINKELDTLSNNKQKEKLIKQKEKLQAENKRLVKEYISKQQKANFDEYYTYSNITDSLSQIKGTNPEINKLLTQADLYFDEANNLIKSNEDKEKLQAVNLSKIAINKQKQAIDYLATVSTSKIANSQNENKNTNLEISLTAEEQSNLSKYSTQKYKLDKKHNKLQSKLAEINEELKNADKIYGPKRSKIKQELISKQNNLFEKQIEINNSYKTIDSLKYYTYKNKLNELYNKKPVKLANEYKKGAEYYYTKAQELRQIAEKETDIQKKHKLLQKAVNFEKTALENQEIALNTILNKNDDVFLTSGCLMKVDPLLVLDKKVPAKKVEALAFDKIVQQINLTSDDIKYMNDLPKYNEAETKTEQALYFANEDLNKLKEKLKRAKNNKEKKKLNKEINKKQEEIIGIKLSLAENQESINDIKYYTLYNHLKENRKKGHSPEVVQARQLEKEASKAYKKAKMLRDKAFMLEETDINKAIEYNNEAYKLENKGLSLMTQAYTVYMNINPQEITEQILAENKNNNPINNQIAEKKSADISAPSKNISANTDTTVTVKNNTITNNKITDTNTISNNNLIAENKQDNTNTFNENKQNSQQNNTEKTAIPIVVTTTNNLNNVADSNENNNKNLQDNSNESQQKDTYQPEKNIRENNITTNEINQENKKYAIYPVSIYNEKNPIPVNPPLPDGIIFKVQIGAFKNPIPQNSFKGLSPIAAEKIKGSKFTRYLAGLFNTYEGARAALSEIKTIGYSDAFIVAYKNGKRVPIYLARTEAKQKLSNYNNLAQTETSMVKNRNKNAVDIAQVNNKQDNNTKISNTLKPVAAKDIKQKDKLLYTVQIGVYKKPVPASRLYNLKPIYQDVTPYGFIRYTTGIFSDKNKAATERDRIRKLGIKDAFVTAYYKGKKITLQDAAKLEAENVNKENEAEIVLPQAKVKPENTNIDVSTLYYKVQIGAYKENIPVEQVSSWLSVARTKDLKQFKDEKGYTIFAVGNYKSYAEAARMKQILINEGVKDAFIVAYAGNKKIPVQKAKELLGK